MQIYLLRHGIADDPKPGRSDAERALTSEGRDKLHRVLKRARAAGVEPTAILSSPYRRAMETAEAAVGVLGFKGTVERTQALTPESSPYDTWAEIRAQRSEAVLLASHEPLMSTLAAFLLNSPALLIDMKKAALVRIDVENAGAQPRGVLKWMLTPATAE